MFAAGQPHPSQAASQKLLERIADGAVEALIDAEVLQEILHRYRALNRWVEGRKAYDLVRAAIPTVLPVTVEILDQTRALMDRNAQLTARDALHAASCFQHGVPAICTFDRDFDSIKGLKRVEPAEVP